nr:zinc finger CCCH domain-containing protein 25 [Tanacetum cinerariifolium]
MIHRRDYIPKENIPPRRRFAFTAPPPGRDVVESSAATTRAPRSQAADKAEDVGYVRALQTSEHRMMTSIEEVNLRVSYQAQVHRQENNLNGAQVLGGTIRVDHVAKYKKKEEGDEEEEQHKRDEHGVYRASHIGECTRGAGCKFSHNEQMYVKIPALGDLDDVVIGSRTAAAIAQHWEGFKKLLMEEYCPDDEIQKLET